MPKTRIGCTIGPSSSSDHALRALIDAGMNMPHLNFSHGTYDDHGEKIEMICRLAREMNRPVTRRSSLPVDRYMPPVPPICFG
jgi:pyruvate kinase